MSNSLQPTDPNSSLALRQTNVSNPSIIHSRPSQQSITASEDYYSLSGSNSSTHSGASARANANRASQSQLTITRYQTPPSRYRTPQQSRDVLPLPQQHEVDEQMGEEPFRQTPMRGHGKRRQSVEEGSSQAAVEQPLLAGSQQQQGQLREGGIRRKPVPSTVMESGSSNRNSRISPTIAQSSVARDINRERDAPTPHVDDTPYIHFALDQLTRDEEVRGSRQYGIAPGIDGNYPYQVPANVQWPTQPQGARYEQLPQEEKDISEQSPYMDNPPPRNPDRLSQSGRPEAQRQGPNVFIPVPQEESRQAPLNFVPGILRPLQLGLFIFVVLAYLICLIVAAAWSRANTGLWRYLSFGDGRYFLFQYFPTMLGMIVLVWLFEVQKAIYRMAPFIAMGSSSVPTARIVAARLPLHPRGFVLPYFGHFGAKLPIIGTFLFIAWLQLFTIPLLGSSFNVYQSNGVWRWIATQGVIWTVIALYILLLLALMILLVWLMRTTTGLKWDPRSLADMIVLLERSNALDGQGESVPQLGYFRTSHRPNEVFHAYGTADKPARSYAVVDGQYREQRYSNPNFEADAANPPRLSKEPMLPRQGTHGDEEALENHHSSALPWFLKPSLALLWPIIAIVLLLAFLIVSYLPSTTSTKGFRPMLPSAVNNMGFSSGNFLYSFIPTFLATLCFVFWMEIDYAYRKLAPLSALASHTRGDDRPGDIPERTLLLSYAADLPILTTLSALFNADYRLAFLTTITLLSTTLPILASGIFWSQFYIPQQRVLISAHMPGYYALTVFLTLHALAYLAIFPPATLRHTTTPNLDTFDNTISLFRQSRLLDDLAFRNPVSKTDLVTRLLSARPGSALVIPNAAAAASKISLADSIRGFGRARAAAAGDEEKATSGAMTKYALGRFVGRDGKEFVGIDRVRN
ncbi:hypothetical protein M409DRAFT_51466 [Zasmidium cellare ATCC 36951]|uniref:Phosphoribosylaminoimidazole-succinocarboxamide synthase n=1 Tax=Zasmidium cellare ATCC 36951 TaxID=1080233 RepID=A0A6A6CTJ9_ZASCE|nr:uncharacterized protein M409DRAFT_51466 [Zasmidium cellare ATCC 36951]KAF2170421.1 hypothetical protein M409DRAFT_51466 [Zasmidium cellare ATCC 36951]